MKKKMFAVIVAAIMLNTNAFAAEIQINNEKINSQLIITKGCTLVPVRGVFEKIGFSVEWYWELKKAVLKKDDTVIIMKAGENNFEANGKIIFPDVPQQIINGRFYIPLRAVVDILPDYEIEWNENEKSIYIRKNEENTSMTNRKNNDYDENISGKNVNRDFAEKKEELNPEIISILADDSSVYINDYVGITVCTNTDTDKVKIETSFKSGKMILDNYVEEDGVRKFLGKIKMTKLGKCKLCFYPGKDNKFKKVSEIIHVNVDKKINENDNSNYVDNSNISDSEFIYTFEKEVFELVNEERRKEGLSELIWDDELAAVARNHSEDMIKRGFFGHVNPDGKRSSDRIYDAGLSSYGYCGENIAAGSRTPKAVMNQWMNSEGHRNNILNENYKKIGIGLACSQKSKGRYYWTQCFTD